MAGTWTVTNDALHRLYQLTGTLNGAPYTIQEAIDHFGNREVETVTSGSNQTQPSPFLNFPAGNNKISGGNYDNAGNLLYDGTNSYLYDAENRICAVQQASTGGGLIGYVYAPNGPRLAKGTLSTFSCDLTQNGFAPAAYYFVGPQGEEMVAVNGAFNALHYNVFWEGKLLGTFTGTTYAQSNWHFALNDWVGTKREVTNSDGTCLSTFSSGPFGDYQTSGCTGVDPSEQHFTSKERDIESGLDYFPARYYNSNLGRFISPDTGADAVMGVPVPYADLTNPQSLNLYSYVGNNPLSRTDPDGHDYTICIPGQPCTHLTDQQYQDAIHGQGNNGINAPAFGQSGNITCGGVACGTATYMDQGAVNDLSGGQLMGLAGGKALEGVMGVVGKAIGQMLGRGAGELAGDAAAGGAKVLLQGGTKQAAKAVVDGLADSAQKTTQESNRTGHD